MRSPEEWWRLCVRMNYEEYVWECTYPQSWIMESICSEWDHLINDEENVYGWMMKSMCKDG